MECTMLKAAWVALSVVAGYAFAGTVEARYPDGTVKAVYECNEYGIMDGQYTEYHPNGAVKMRGIYAGGRRAGAWVGSNDSGFVTSTQEYGEAPMHETPAADSPATPRLLPAQTGLKVVAGGPDVEVLVGGRSFGAHDSLLIPLPAGRYRVVGRKRGCFDDIESEDVAPGAGLTEVSLTPRRMRVEFSPRIGVVVSDGEPSGPVLCLTAGVRTVRRSWGALLMTKMPPGAGTGNSSHFIIAAHYTFVNVCTPHVVLETGLASGYCRTALMVDAQAYQPGYTEYVKHVSRRGVLGPRMLFHVGAECVKFVLGTEYLMLCDDWLSIESSRNLLAMYGGFALGF